MPELPDVEAFRQYCNSTALHQKIKEVEVKATRVLKNISQKEFVRRMKNRSLESTQRHGKYMFATLDDGNTLVLHFGMTGFLEYYKDQDKEPPHARVICSFTNGYHIAYDCQRLLGEVRIVDDIDVFISKQKLGPDALDDALDLNTFMEILNKKRGAVKSALMDQNSIAGIGNIYADEILFQTGIHPKTNASNLDADTIKKLYRTMKRVLKVTAAKKADPDEFPRSYLIPHRGEDNKCPRCKGEIKTIKVSGRTAYYCPRCQKKQ